MKIGMEHLQRTCVIVDLDAIRSNMERMKANISEQTKIIGVIKTDGYGHGAIPIAKEIEALPFLEGFATATEEEAYELQERGNIKKPILILGYTFPVTMKSWCAERFVRRYFGWIWRSL